MQKKMQRLAATYVAQNHRHRVWKKIVSVLACIVVFCTTYALILPAITLENTTLYCGLDEHTHDESCYEKNMTCAAESDTSHEHTDECYQTVLTCGKKEHVHALACSSDPNADIETAEDWQNSVAGAALTGNWHKDLVAVAESQLGYTESEKNFAVGEDGETKYGYTRYGAWSGDPYGDWNTAFVSFCLSYAGIPAGAFPTDKSSSAWLDALKSAGNDFYREKDKYVPKAGDLIFYDTNGDKTADSVGLVAELIDATETEPVALRAIEGNSQNCVQLVKYSLSDAGIVGYGRLPTEPRVTYTWSGNGMEVVASFRDNAEIPANAALVVKPLTYEELGDAYGNKYAASQAKIAELKAAEITKFDLFKIYLEADGKEVLSGEDATVEIRFTKAESGDKTCTELYHYAADGSVRHDNNLREENGSLVGSFDTALSGEYAVVLADIVQVLADGDTETGTSTTADDKTVLTPHKYIDALRDGYENPDTQLRSEYDKTDLYRLYLDAEMSAVNKPIDLLIVVDQSGSMHGDYTDTEKFDDMKKENNADAYRDEALRLVLNGYSDRDPTAYDKNKENSLIYQFLNANKENRVCVVGFQGHDGYGDKFKENDELITVTSGYIRDRDGNLRVDGKQCTSIDVPSGIADENGFLEAETLLNWTDEAQYVDVRGIYFNATNYTAGFTQMERELVNAKTSSANRKVILFLSDGIPTCYIERVTTESKWVEGTLIPFRPGHFEDVSVDPYYKRGGDGQTETEAVANATTTAFNNFIATYQQDIDSKNVILHTVSMRSDAAKDRLTNMAKGGGGQCFPGNTTDELRYNLKQLMFGAVYTNLEIHDTLSQYVDIYDAQPDYKVTLKRADGSQITLWDKDGITPDGEGIIETVGRDPEDLANSKKVVCKLKPSYTAAPGTTITLSFNIKTNRTAYEYYAQHGYPHTGDGIDKGGGTDYNDHHPSAVEQGNKPTSSGQGGFRSNAKATVTYTLNKEPNKSLDYPFPVVQAGLCKVAVEKTDKNTSELIQGAQFTLYRKPYAGEPSVTVQGLTGNYVQVGTLSTTDENGRIVFDNLIPDEYWLVETKAPEGYMSLEAPINFTLERYADGTGKIVGTDYMVKIYEENGKLSALQVPNTPWGHELPSTGGDGTVTYTVGGALLITAALFLMYQKKRRGKGDMTCS